MNEEEQEALKVLKGLEFEEYDWYVKTDSFEGHAGEVVEKVEEAIKTILNLIEKQQDEIESYKERYENMKLYFDNQEDNLIHKNRIKEKLEEIRKQYNNILSSDNVSLEFKKINSHRFDAMSQVLEELLKGI